MTKTAADRIAHEIADRAAAAALDFAPDHAQAAALADLCWYRDADPEDRAEIGAAASVGSEELEAAWTSAWEMDLGPLVAEHVRRRSKE